MKHAKRFVLVMLIAMMAASAAACGNQTVKQTMEKEQEKDTQKDNVQKKTQKDTQTETQKESVSETETETESAAEEVQSDDYFKLKPLTDSNSSKEDNADIFEADYQYEQIIDASGAAADVADAINAALLSDLERARTEAEDVENNAKEGYSEYSSYQSTVTDDTETAFAPYAYKYQTKVVRNDHAVVSFCIRTDVNKQGAHGSYTYHCLNFDAKTGEEITWDTLSADTDAFKAAVLSKVTALANTDDYKDRLYDTPENTDFSSAIFNEGTFALTKDGMEIVVDPYILGPYASGAFTFKLTWDDLSGIKDSFIHK